MELKTTGPVKYGHRTSFIALYPNSKLDRIFSNSSSVIVGLTYFSSIIISGAYLLVDLDRYPALSYHYPESDHSGCGL